MHTLTQLTLDFELAEHGLSHTKIPAHQSAFVERFNRTFRHEGLNDYVFELLDQVREISAEWMREYNEERPHDTLDGMPLTSSGSA